MFFSGEDRAWSFPLPLFAITIGETGAHGLLSKHVDMELGSYIIDTLVGDIGAMGFKKVDS